MPVRIDAESGRSHYAQLIACKSAWACPYCATRKWIERAALLSLAFHRWANQGGRVALVTLTVRHSKSDTLADLMTEMRHAFQAMQQGRGFRGKKQELGVVGWTKRFDVTYSCLNGWHLHLHLCAFIESGTGIPGLDGDDEQDIEAYETDLRDVFFDAWLDAVKKSGRQNGLPTREHGVHVKLLDLADAPERAAEYCAGDYVALPRSAAAEGAGDAGGKIAAIGSRTYWQILDEAVQGHLSSARLVNEYELATKGVNTFDRPKAARLRPLFAPDLSESDALVNEPLDVVVLTESEHRLLRRLRREAALLERVEAGFRSGIECAREEALDALDSWNVRTDVDRLTAWMEHIDLFAALSAKTGDPRDVRCTTEICQIET